MAETRLEIIASVRDQMSRTVRTIQNGFRGFFDRTLQGFRNLGRQLFSVRGALAGLATYLGGRALVRHARDIATTTAEYELWAQKLGTTVGELDRLAYAAEQNGLSFDALREGLKTLQERLDDAQRGTRTQAEQFERLGIRVVDSNGHLKNAVDLVDELAAAYQRFEREGRTEELVLITEDLIGGTENLLSVLLSKGPEAIAKWKQVAEEIGVVSERQARAAAGVRNAFADMDRAIRQVGVRFLEIFSVDIIATLRTAARVIAENLDDVVVLVTKAIAGLVTLVALLVQGLMGLFNLVERIAGVFGSDFGFGLVKATQRANDLAGELQSARSELDKLQKAAGSGQDVGGQVATVERTISDLEAQLAIQEAIARALAWGSGEAEGFTDIVSELTKKFRTLYGVVREEAANAIAGGGLLPDRKQISETTSDLELYFKTVEDGFRAWGDRLRDVKTNASQLVQTISQSIEDNLTNALWDAISGVKSLRDAFRDALRDILGDIAKSFLRSAVRNMLGGLTNMIFNPGGAGGGGGMFSLGDSGGSGGSGSSGGLEGLSRRSGAGAMQAVGSGDTHVHFTVHAIDAQSFRKALSEQRRDIVDMVSDAVRRQPATRRLITGR